LFVPLQIDNRPQGLPIRHPVEHAEIEKWRSIGFSAPENAVAILPAPAGSN